MQWPYSSSIDELIENIRVDFLAFAHIDIEREGAGYIGISWDGVKGKQQVRIRLKDLIVIHRNSTKEYNYKDFLASEYLGNLTAIANTITKIIPPPTIYEPLTAQVTDEDDLSPGMATEIIENVLKDSPYNATNLLFVRAPAGCGKTQTMLKLTVDRADNYRKGLLPLSEAWIYLYVDAQGQALANIDSVLAKCLDDLRASIGYQAVSALVRNDLIVPIIDGFDELIGSGGYADAFGSLSSFLSMLERSGSVVATGRSTFYDMHVLKNMAQRYEAGESLNFKFRSIEINQWDEEGIKSYFIRALLPDVAIAACELVESTSDINKKLLSKPFYASRVAQAYAKGEIFHYDANILDQLMDSFLIREAGKFLNKQGSVILDKNGHERLLRLVAEEMWWTERRSIDLETLQEYAVLIAEELKITPEDAEILRGKMSSYAFIEIDRSQERQQWYKFEHDVYYEYFLLGALLKYLTEDIDQLKSFLTRSLLGESLIDHFANKTVQLSAGEITSMVKTIASVTYVSRMGLQLSRNAGTLLMVLTNKRDILPSGISVRNIEFTKGKMRNSTFNMWSFHSCRFDDVDLRGTTFNNVAFSDVIFDKICIDTSNTRFIDTIVRPQDVISFSIDQNYVYEPSKIIDALVKMGVPGLTKVEEVKYSPRQEEAIEVLNQFLRRVERRYYFDVRQKDDHEFQSIKNRRLWPEVEQLLMQCGLIEDRKIRRSGPQTYIQHLSQPVDKIREGENKNIINLPPAVRCLWDGLLNL